VVVLLSNGAVAVLGDFGILEDEIKGHDHVLN
jgi:hypothetical protein